MRIGSWSIRSGRSNIASGWACRKSDCRSLVRSVGFHCPVLGRLDDPNLAIELLTGFDDKEAHEISHDSSKKNEERKEIVQVIYDG